MSRERLPTFLLLVGVLPRASVPLSLALGAAVLVTGLLPVGLTLAAGVLAGAVPSALRGGFDSPEGRTASAALPLVVAVFAIGQAIGPLRTGLATALGSAVEQYSETYVARAVCAPPGIAHLEAPATLDQIDQGKGVGTTGFTPGKAVQALAVLAPEWLHGLGSVGLLCVFRWWLGVLLLAAWSAVAYLHLRERQRASRVVYDQVARVRRAGYFRDLALLPGPAKELRLLGLSSWLRDRFTAGWTQAMAEIKRDRRRGRPVIAALTLLPAASSLLAFAALGQAAAAGEVGLTALATYAGAIIGTGSLAPQGNEALTLAHGSAAVRAALALDGLAAAVSSPLPRRARVPAAGLREGIRFQAVDFRYPGQQADTLSGLDLFVPAGRSLAIVGANGAGKTTLAKLLCRLYDPTGGRISADGVDLRDLDPAEWRRNVAAVFQDFVQYPLTVRENIRMGAPSGPLPTLWSPAAEGCHLEAAAARAGALDLIEALPQRWDTVLSRQFSGGADLSGGEWQRIALARAFYAVDAGARLLILDEPTAHLDVRAEASFYERLLDAAAGLTTILISHRFSTVRRADKICVLAAGRVAEEGTHEELLGLGGRYAAMFALQARRFGDAA